MDFSLKVRGPVRSPGMAPRYTEADREEALRAHRELPSIRQAIGALGPRLRRTKPGSKLHQQYWGAMTRLEGQADELSSTITMFIRLVEIAPQ